MVIWGLALAAVPVLGGPGQAGDFDPQPDAGFDAWKARFRGRALAQGLSASVVDGALASAQFLPGVIAKDRGQLEFSLSFEDYLAIAVSDERVAAGRKALRKQRGLLGQIEKTYGVPAQVVTAIWGVESFYGTKRGEVPVMSALATLCYDGRRAPFFESQLLAAMTIVATGVRPEHMTGGWAGAMGHTQFIPTTYLGFRQDFRGDGVADIWGEDPTDALASAANYLMRSGWQTGAPSGQEVLVPKGLVPSGTRKLKARSVKDWAAQGVQPARGAFAAGGSAGLMLPAGPTGPAFLVWSNFAVLKRYNASDSYALAVGILADRIAGGPGLVGRFPPDRNGLYQADRVLVQKRLTALGYDCGSVDGVFGPKTAAAVAGWQASQGLPVTGVADASVVAALR
jgi:lytic murein transglycosylase